MDRRIFKIKGSDRELLVNVGAIFFLRQVLKQDDHDAVSGREIV